MFPSSQLNLTSTRVHRPTGAPVHGANTIGREPVKYKLARAHVCADSDANRAEEISDEAISIDALRPRTQAGLDREGSLRPMDRRL